MKLILVSYTGGFLAQMTSFWKILLAAIVLFIGSVGAQSTSEHIFLDNEGKVVSLPETAVAIYFLDVSITKSESDLRLLHKMALTFRQHKVAIIAVYSDFEEAPEGFANSVQDLTSTGVPLWVDVARENLQQWRAASGSFIILDSDKQIVFNQASTTTSYEEIKFNIEVALGYRAPEETIPVYQDLFMPIDFTGIGDTDQKIALLASNDNTTDEVSTPSNPPTENISTGNNTENTESVDTENSNTSTPETPHSTGDTEETNSNPVLVDNETTSENTTETPSNVSTPTEENITSPMLASYLRVNSREAATLVTEPTKKTVGYRSANWGIRSSVADAFFYSYLDLLVKLIPLCIWFWATLYCIPKVRLYKGMGLAVLGSFAMFTWYLGDLLLHMPFEVFIFIPEFWEAKVFIIQGFQQFYQLLTPSAAVYWKPELFLILIMQLFLLRGLAGRHKEDPKIKIS